MIKIKQTSVFKKWISSLKDKGVTMDIQELDISEYLDEPEVIAEYLNAAIEENDISLFFQAIGNVAKAEGMTKISKESGVTREALYRALSGNIQPKFETVVKVLRAFNFKLTVQKTERMGTGS